MNRQARAIQARYAAAKKFRAEHMRLVASEQFKTLLQELRTRWSSNG